MVSVMALLMATPTSALGQQLTGRVYDSGTGRVIPNAQVSLVDPTGVVRFSTSSDSSGLFSTPLVLGDSAFVYVEALGYLAMVDGPVVAVSKGELSVEFSLRPIPLEVEGVVVTSERQVTQLAQVGFYQRQATGAGYQLDQSVLERRGRPVVVSDWLRGIPGVSVDNEVLLRRV